MYADWQSVKTPFKTSLRIAIFSDIGNLRSEMQQFTIFKITYSKVRKFSAATISGIGTGSEEQFVSWLS